MGFLQTRMSVCFFMWANFLALCWHFGFISNNDLAIFLKVSQKVTSSLLHDGVLIYKTTWQKSSSPLYNSWIIKASFREMYVPEATLYKKAADYFPPCEEESETLSEDTLLKPVFLPFIVTEPSGVTTVICCYFLLQYIFSVNCTKAGLSLAVVALESAKKNNHKSQNPVLHSILVNCVCDKQILQGRRIIFFFHFPKCVAGYFPLSV